MNPQNHSDGSNLRNIGLVAHVDAGKTTTTEQMLHQSGLIRSPGRVDNGTAHTDWLEVERARGISVMASTVCFSWKGVTVNLIDTPGHVDFSSEVERSLRVLDGAVLIISAAEGVEAHTETLWRALHAMHMPTLIYINKMDRIGVQAKDVLAEIRDVLAPHAVPVQQPLGEGPAFGGVRSLFAEATEREAGEKGDFGDWKEQLTAFVAERDESVLARYVDGVPIPPVELEAKIADLTRNAKAVPVLFGASAREIGVAELMDAAVRFLPAPQGRADEPLSGVVFKLEQDKAMGRVAHVRLYSGSIQNRDPVYNATRDKQEKVAQIRKVNIRRHKDLGIVEAGDIAAVYGLSEVRIGDVLGDPSRVPPEHRLTEPLLAVQVHPADAKDYPALAEALQQLSDEDPLLGLQRLPEERELHIKVVGTIQLEVLAGLLRERFGLDARFDPPTVIYKETPATAGEGFVAYTMPKPCWAILRFRIEPGERGSGLTYSSTVRTENLLQRYQNEVERRVPEALEQGLYGWEVTDLHVTLIEGEHHVWHTHPLDFAVATPMGIMDGLANTGTRLLEPMLAFRISVPEHIGGRVLSDLSLMRGTFDSPVVRGGRFTVEGTVPLATSMDYPIRLRSLSGGQGTMTTRFACYRECPPDVHAERKRRGVNPLDRSNYILSVRNALSRE